MAPLQGFRTFSLQVIRAAHHARPMDELIRDLGSSLLGVVPCAVIELWLMERTRSARWVLDAKTRSFARSAELEAGLFEALDRRCGQPPTALASLDELPEEARTLLDSSGTESYQSVLCLPLAMDDERIGFLLLRDDRADSFAHLDATLMLDLAHALTAALAHNRIHLAQRERVKELSCLYELAHLATLDDRDLDSILEHVVALLPPSWQRPDLAMARIELDGSVVETRAYDPTWQTQRADIRVGGARRGSVLVAYTRDLPPLDEGPFLAEERRLIDTVANELSTIITRKAARQERLQLQEQLRHADRLATIGHLAAGVAHELNEPLGAILGFAQLARKHPALVEDVDRDLEKIEAAALHAREVTARLRNVGRRHTPKPESLDLNSVVRDALAFLGARMAKHRIAPRTTLQRGLPRLTANRAQIQQVVINLVVNAMQAMPKGGDLDVMTATDGEALALVVRDTGIGMSERVMARIFEPFFTTKQANDGTGLGLPVVKEIVESLHGGIEVQSEPGAGATFRVTLPMAPTASSPEVLS